MTHQKIKKENTMNQQKFSPEHLNQIAQGYFQHYLGIVVTEITEGEVKAEFSITPSHLAPNGFLHAGSIVTLADTAAGCGAMTHLPEDAASFTTIELKSNFIGTARQGTVQCIAKAVHLGRTTQVWDAAVYEKDSCRTIALFRCTQMILFPK
jgi:1,4-dihydroxy-2-naphthoyl-CoA hydrolase